MASCKIIIGDKSNSKGLVPVYLFVIHNRHKIRIPVKGLKVTLELWDKKYFIPKHDKAIQNHKITNETLKNYELIALRTINRLAEQNSLEYITVTELADAISIACFNKKSVITHTFASYTEKLISDLQKSKRYGTAECYNDAISFVKRRFGRDMQFGEITYEALRKMETNHFAAGKTVNSLSFYMRTIRAIYRKAVLDHIASSEHDPFSSYKIRNQETKKRAISLDHIIALSKLKLRPGSEADARNYFMFSFYSRGMNFTDMAMLKIDHLEGDRIIYRRAKTGRLFNIKLIAQVKKILAGYIAGKNASDYIFPIITQKNDLNVYKEIGNKRKQYNESLSVIAKKAKIDVSLTSYVSRHSWATIAKHAGVPVEVISEGLGHKDVRTTQIYLDSFSDSVMDEAANKIAGLIIHKKR